MVRNNKGMTLIEVMIALLILSVGVLGVSAMQGTFASQSADRNLLNALTDAAMSAANQCHAQTTPPASVVSGGVTVAIGLTGSCTPALDTCNEISVIASARGKSTRINTNVCNFN
jgi:prepilin-type N-terminal cleavage/methylation domain-containing protein